MFESFLSSHWNRQTMLEHKYINSNKGNLDVTQNYHNNKIVKDFNLLFVELILTAHDMMRTKVVNRWKLFYCFLFSFRTTPRQAHAWGPFLKISLSLRSVASTT